MPYTEKRVGLSAPHIIIIEQLASDSSSDIQQKIFSSITLILWQYNHSLIFADHFGPSFILLGHSNPKI